MNTREYIAAIKTKHALSSDYAVAKLLGVSRNRMSEWQAGKGAFGTLTCFKVAELLGEQPAGVIAEIELERAEKLAKEDEADAWKGVLKKLGGTAASILLACSLGGFSNADAKLRHVNDDAENTHRMKPKRRRNTWMAGLLPSWIFVL